MGGGAKPPQRGSSSSSRQPAPSPAAAAAAAAAAAPAAAPTSSSGVGQLLRLAALLVWAAVTLPAAPVFASSPPPASSSPADLLKLGDAAFAAGNFNSAVQSYSAALDLDSKTALFFTKRAAAYVALRKLSSALIDLDAALEVDSNSTAGLLQRGKLHGRMCKIEDARRDLTALLALRPNHASATKELASLQELETAFTQLQLLQQQQQQQAQQGQQQQEQQGPDATGAAAAAWPAAAAAAARSALDKVFVLAPECLPAQLLDAQIAYAADEYEQAIAATGRLIKAAPSHLEALHLRGLAYQYLGDTDLAKRHFGEALRFDPDHTPSAKAFSRLKELERKRKRAESALETQDLAGAAEAFTAALAVDPQHKHANKQMHLGLCRVQQQLGKTDEAVESCKTALALDSSEGWGLQASKELVRALLAGQRWEEAVQKARELLQAHQQDGELHQLYSEAERALKISKRKDYYKMLGVDPSASTRDIKKAYKSLARQHHPDKVASGSEEDKKAAEDKFREIAEAHEVLTDDAKRALFDAGEDPLQANGGGGHPGAGGHPFFHQGGYTYTFHF